MWAAAMIVSVSTVCAMCVNFFLQIPLPSLRGYSFQNVSNSKSYDLGEGLFGFFLGSIGLVLPGVAGGATCGSGGCNVR